MQHYRICCLVYVHLKLYIHIVAFITAYWHCSHTMWKGLCNSMMSIHLSVCLFHPSATAAACGGFTARHLAGRQYWPSHHLATASYGSKDLGTRPRTWPSRPRTWPSRPRTWPSRPRFDLRRRVAQTTAHTHTHPPFNGPLSGTTRWASTRKEQEAQLSPSDRAMRLVSSNLANYHTTVQKLLIRQVLTKPMVWSWKFSWRQCVINKPTTVVLCISPVYRRLAVVKFSKSTM